MITLFTKRIHLLALIVDANFIKGFMEFYALRILKMKFHSLIIKKVVQIFARINSDFYLLIAWEGNILNPQYLNSNRKLPEICSFFFYSIIFYCVPRSFSALQINDNILEDCCWLQCWYNIQNVCGEDNKKQLAVMNNSPVIWYLCFLKRILFIPIILTFVIKVFFHWELRSLYFNVVITIESSTT